VNATGAKLPMREMKTKAKNRKWWGHKEQEMQGTPTW
jgi:hypothetical protein